MVTALLALAAVGCSGGATRLSPVGPSPVAEDPGAVSSVTAASWAASRGWSTFADGRVAVADGLLVEGIDVVGDVTGTCPRRTITVRGVPVAVSPSTTFTAPLTCEALSAGKQVKVTGLLTYSSSGFSVNATELAAAGGETDQKPPAGRRGERVNGVGVVGVITGACPSLTLVISGYRVQTTSDTGYVGGTCESLREGTEVDVAAERDSEGRITAERIVLTRVPGPPQ